MFGLILALSFLSIFYLYWKRKCRKHPPGPPRVPILGSVPFITMKRGIMDWVMDKSVTKHRLATVGIGPKDFIVINDFELAKELFGKEEFSGRQAPEFVLAQKYFDGKRHGILITEGAHWSKQRRFGLKTFGLESKVWRKQ